MKHKANFTAQQNQLLDQHRLAMDDLDDYSAFLNAWQAIVDETNASSQNPPNYSAITDFEKYASYAVKHFLETGTGRTSTISQDKLEIYECAAVTVTSAGTIRQTNHLAATKEQLVVGKSLAECGLKVFDNATISTFLESQNRDNSSPYQLIQSPDFRAETYATLALSQIDNPSGSETLYLVLFVTPPDTDLAAQILAQKFNLTPMEAKVAKAFLDGIPLRDIATLRKRSSNDT